MKSKRTKIFDVILLISYPIGITIFSILYCSPKVPGKEDAGAIGGKIVDNIYYLVLPNGKFVETSAMEWFQNLGISVLLIITFLLMMIGMVYGFIKYGIPYMNEQRKNIYGNRNLF